MVRRSPEVWKLLLQKPTDGLASSTRPISSFHHTVDFDSLKAL